MSPPAAAAAVSVVPGNATSKERRRTRRRCCLPPPPAPPSPCVSPQTSSPLRLPQRGGRGGERVVVVPHYHQPITQADISNRDRGSFARLLLRWSAPTLLLAARIAVCVAMSAGGLTNRLLAATRSISGGSSPFARDAVCAAFENFVILTCLFWAWRRAGCGSTKTASSASSSSSSWAEGTWTPGGCCSSTPASPSGESVRSHARLRCGSRRWRRIDAHAPCSCLRRLLSTSLVLLWTLASWGDYVFQTESSGQVPTLWVVAPGLKDPALHARVQMNARGDIFWGGLVKVLMGLVGGIAGWAVLAWVESKLRRRQRARVDDGSLKKKDSDLGDCLDCGKVRRRYSDDRRYCSRCCKQNVDDVRPRTRIWPVSLMAMLVLYLFTTGSWSPVTNLIYCAMGSMVLVPPGGGPIDPEVLTKKRTKVLAERGIPSHTIGAAADPMSNNEKGSEAAAEGHPSSRCPRPPNVIMIVHESLGGAALESKRGREAAPYFHRTLRSDPNFYSFANGRAVAGVTPLATPAILTGLLPYDDGCMEQLRSHGSLGHEFGAAGYDTGSFVSYGHDWAGGTWAIIEEMVKPGFDYLAGPEQTGEPVVNEYGMDDRVLVRHLTRWMDDRVRASIPLTGHGTAYNNQEGGAEAASPAAAVATDQRHARSTLRGGSSDGTDASSGGSAAGASDKPFFALVVFNNNHFPHLVHDTYAGLPPECFQNNNSTNDAAAAREGCKDGISDASFVRDWDEDGGGDSIDPSEVDGSGLGGNDDSRLGFDDCDYDNWQPAEKHYYYINGEKYDCEGSVGHYYSSFRTTDESLRSIFLALEESGELNNTIVVGAGDHGETPITLKRLNDVDAPILQVPIWMRVPRELLPESAFLPPTKSDVRSGATYRNRTHNRPNIPVDKDTHLRSNIHKTVSVLDIMPTLREILNYTHAYTQDERRLCITGSSLLSRTLSSQRIVPGWQGPPLQPGQSKGIFMSHSEALVHYEDAVEESHIAEFRFDDEDPIFKLFERRSGNWTKEERNSWMKALRDGGWLEGGRNAGFVSRRMPTLHKVLEDIATNQTKDAPFKHFG